MVINLKEARAGRTAGVRQRSFLKGFDEQLVGVKINDTKILNAHFLLTIQKKNLQIKKLNLNVKF